MSWNLFNRQAKRSLVTKAEERDFERECTKMQHLEESSKKISKDSKKIVSAINIQGKASQKVGHDLMTDLSDHAPESLEQFEIAMNKQAMLAFDKANMIQQYLVAPMKQYNTIFPYCTTHIKSREKALQEYNKVQAKLEKYEEREHTGSNTVKIEMTKKELHPVKDDFERKNETLMKEMPELYNARLAYLQPSLEAILSTQCWFHKETLKTLERCAKELNVDADEKEDIKVKNILEDIKLLSITSDD